MKIRYLAASPKAGQVEHIRNDVGVTLIAAGFAEAVPYKDFRERLRVEGQPTPDPNVGKTEWGIKDAADSGFRCVTVIKKIVGGETTYLSAPPPDCPKSIVQRFNDLSNDTSRATTAADLDAARNRQIEYEHSLENVKRY